MLNNTQWIDYFTLDIILNAPVTFLFVFKKVIRKRRKKIYKWNVSIGIGTRDLWLTRPTLITNKRNITPKFFANSPFQSACHELWSE